MNFTCRDYPYQGRIKVNNDEKLSKSLNDITTSLRSFIGFTMDEDDKNWAAWITSVSKKIEVRCWEKKACAKVDCPAYKNECGRCWLIAGSKCLCNSSIDNCDSDGTTRCINCEIYLANIADDPYSEIQEQIITLVHSLRSRQIELKELATQDQLTGLKNRHFFDLYMFHEMEKLKRANVKNMALLMMDVNDFKVINDTCGHLVGDHVLKECAAILTGSIRASDVLFRFGGDEFLVVMAAAGQSEAEILQRRIFDNIKKWNSRPNKYDIRISISIGSALLTADSDLLQVLDQADKMMYENKRKDKMAAGKVDVARGSLGGVWGVNA